MNDDTNMEEQDIAKKAAEDEKRRAHEKAEATRKEKWEAKQKAKKTAEAKALADIDAMSDMELRRASEKRIGADIERLTRRNMKQSVAQYVQAMCKCDPAFARLAMHPRKNMLHCFRYINRKAKEYLEQEMKENDYEAEDPVNLEEFTAQRIAAKDAEDMILALPSTVFPLKSEALLSNMSR